MDFKTIYDLQNESVRGWFLPLVGLFFMAFALRAWIRKEGWSRTYTRSAYSTPRAAFIFGVIFFSIATFATWVDYFTMLNAEKSDAFLITEGPVSKFTPAATEKGQESFQVRGGMFTYGKYETKNGFHTLKMEGSPIADGVYVRIAHLKNHILKLEIGSPQ